MIYYVFKEQMILLFLTVGQLSSISFPTKVYDYVGGEKRDFQIYEMNRSKSLVIDSKRGDLNKNFIVFLKSGRFHFDLRSHSTLLSRDIEIKEAKKCSVYTLLKETSGYQLFECPRSLLVINKSKSALQINELSVKDKMYLSKGPAIYLEDKLIYFQGRVL